MDYDCNANILIISGHPNIKEKVISNDMKFLDKSFTPKELLEKLQEIVK